VTLTFEEQEALHRQAKSETGFWGRQGSGCLVYARDTGRYLVQLRSEDVLEGGTWGIWGGAVDEGLTPEENALAELMQETGFDGEAELHFLVDFVSETSSFRYRNFLAVVDQEFDPILNWEGEDSLWCEIGEFPGPLHFGLEYLLSKVPEPAQHLGIATKPVMR
jgi:8-oxo-dGTP pyrophosphatase MutT (NUDIX family)